jgi:hypothetical protein
MAETRTNALIRYARKMRIIENRKGRSDTNPMSEFISPKRRRRIKKYSFNEEGD